MQPAPAHSAGRSGSYSTAHMWVMLVAVASLGQWQVGHVISLLLSVSCCQSQIAGREIAGAPYSAAC